MARNEKSSKRVVRGLSLSLPRDSEVRGERERVRAVVPVIRYHLLLPCSEAALALTLLRGGKVSE